MGGITFCCGQRLDPNSPIFHIYSDYLNRIRRRHSSQIISPVKKTAREGDQFLVDQAKKIAHQPGYLFFLDPCGHMFSSEDLAKVLREKLDNNLQVGFVVGGAYGLPKELNEVSRDRWQCISLSKLTLSHEIALLIMVEQVYRALCISTNHPYHHGTPSPFSSLLS